MNMTANAIAQILISGIDLYLQHRRQGEDLDQYTKDQVRDKLRELNNELREIPDLPTDEE